MTAQDIINLLDYNTTKNKISYNAEHNKKAKEL